MKIKESNITINLIDLNKSIAFYESIGFTLQNRLENYYAQLIAPGIVIGLHPVKDTNLVGSSSNVSIGLTTDDYEDTKSSLKSLSINASERKEAGGQFLHF